MKTISALNKTKMGYQIAFSLGVLLFGLAVFLLYKNIAFLKTSNRAKGEVVALEEIYRNSSKPTYKPVFEFITKDGKTIVHTSISSSNPPSWKVGEKAVYAYQAAAPDKGKVVTYFGVFGWVVALLCIALPLLVIGVGYFISQSILNSIINGF